MAILSILTINCGSSSLKASLFLSDGSRRDFRYGHISDDKTHSLQEAFNKLLNDLGPDKPTLLGHRFVHGGDITDAARSIDDAERARLQNLTHLAPLHLPSNLLGLDVCRKLFNVPQIACFDTAFHANMPALSKRLPIPNELGLRRFGFHGINYAYIAKTLPDIIGETACKKVIVAHLGSGASLCLMENLKSLDTTMGYTPAGGITMGTRSGDLDPGVMVELAKHYTPEQLSDLVFHKMGLLALSEGESAEMQDLLTSESEHAKFAVEYFCQQVRGAIGALAAKAGGVDALVFTAGIGEHSAEIRQKICAPLAFIGFSINMEQNLANATQIAQAGSKPIVIIPADEEIMIRDLCLNLIQ
ncbi:MAG TPA: acetate kinase [Methylotenera sp.]|nr:acetate kinase [Methylotenera sp.]